MNGMDLSREIKRLAKRRESEYGQMRKKYERFVKLMFCRMCRSLEIPARPADVKIHWPFVEPVKDKKKRTRRPVKDTGKLR